MPEIVTTLRPRVKDRTAAERQRRYRNKNKQTGSITLPVPSPAAVTRVTAGVDVAAYAAAIALAGCAAFLSIKGMTVIFPSMPAAVIGMAGAMEAAKLVTAGWLAAHWSVTPWVARLT